MSRLSLLLHESEVKPRMSVNNNDNLQVQWDSSGFYPSAFDVYNNHDQLLITSNKHGLSISISFVFKMRFATFCDVCNSIIIMISC